MAVPTTSTYDPILQELYSTERLQDMCHSESPTLEKIKKLSDFNGRNFTGSWKYAGNEAVAGTISDAQGMLGGTLAVDVHLTRKTMLAVARIDCELLDTAFVNKGAFVTAIDEETRHIEKSFTGSIASMIFRNGGGSIGRLSHTAAIGTPTVLLADPREAHAFRAGMVLKSSDTDGNSGAVRAGQVVLSSVNYDTGALTATGNWSAGIGAIAVDDYLFPLGRFGLGWAGFEAYCPAVAPGGGDSFYGANRSVSPTLLAGHRVTAAGGTIEDALIDALTKAPPHIKPKQIIMNPYRVGVLLRENAGKATYVRTDNSKNAMGASSLSIVTPMMGAPLEIISDPYCQRDVAWFVDLADFTIKGSKSGYVHVQRDKTTGYIWFPVATENQVEMRMASYANMWCSSPWNIQRLAF